MRDCSTICVHVMHQRASRNDLKAAAVIDALFHIPGNTGCRSNSTRAQIIYWSVRKLKEPKRYLIYFAFLSFAFRAYIICFRIICRVRPSRVSVSFVDRYATRIKFDREKRGRITKRMHRSVRAEWISETNSPELCVARASGFFFFFRLVIAQHSDLEFDSFDIATRTAVKQQNWMVCTTGIHQVP